MGKRSQRKGADGERELAAILREYGYTVERGGSMSFGEVPDLVGLPGIHIEVKRCEQVRLSEWIQQAETDSKRFGDGIRRSHSEAVDKWNELDGSKLSDDAKLLEMNIPMNQVQFQQLCTKHKDNSLMLSLLCQYADRHRDSDLYADRPADAATRKAEFDDYAARAANVCREPQSIRAGLFLENNGVAESVSYEY